MSDRAPTGRVIRVSEDRARGVMVLQGWCSCGWRSVRVECRDHGNVARNAPATNKVGRLVSGHFRRDHPG